MTIVVDASALVAMMTDESEAEKLLAEVMRHRDRLCSPIGVWEAARAVARKRKVSVSLAAEAVDRITGDLDLKVAPTGAAEAHLALQAHDRYGKGTGHPAQLNMGDCFAYACAKANNARLLYKGDDFSHTDLA